jgi:hypothetical protein
MGNIEVNSQQLTLGGDFSPISDKKESSTLSQPKIIDGDMREPSKSDLISQGQLIMSEQFKKMILPTNEDAINGQLGELLQQRQKIEEEIIWLGSYGEAIPEEPIPQFSIPRKKGVDVPKSLDTIATPLFSSEKNEEKNWRLERATKDQIESLRRIRMALQIKEPLENQPFTKEEARNLQFSLRNRFTDPSPNNKIKGQND